MIRLFTVGFPLCLIRPEAGQRKNSPPAEKHICVLGEEKLAKDEHPTFFPLHLKI